jgi:F-type H+-transporting ATPase subunit epsilon
MKSFVLELLSPSRTERVEGIVSFVGRDASGSFGILPDAARRISALSLGLAQIRFNDGRTEYLALPGGLLYFVSNVLRISSEEFVRDANFERISAVLEKKRVEEEGSVSETRRSLHRLDEEIMKRLSRMKWGSGE